MLKKKIKIIFPAFMAVCLKECKEIENNVGEFRVPYFHPKTLYEYYDSSRQM